MLIILLASNYILIVPNSFLSGQLRALKSRSHANTQRPNGAPERIYLHLKSIHLSTCSDLRPRERYILSAPTCFDRDSPVHTTQTTRLPVVTRRTQKNTHIRSIHLTCIHTCLYIMGRKHVCRRLASLWMCSAASGTRLFDESEHEKTKTKRNQGISHCSLGWHETPKCLYICLPHQNDCPCRSQQKRYTNISCPSNSIAKTPKPIPNKNPHKH